MNEPRMRFQLIFEQILGREIKENELYDHILLDVSRKLEKILGRKIKHDELIYETLREYNEHVNNKEETK